MTEGVVEVAPGYKFAVVAVPEARGHLTVPLRSVGAGLAASRGLPTGALDSWRDNLGTFRIGELAKARVFLWTLTPSDTPEVLDQENEDLSTRAYQSQADQADARKVLGERLGKLWQDLLAVPSDATSTVSRARRIQDQLFAQRRDGPEILDWVYRLFRDRDERHMKDLAGDLASEFDSTQHA